MQAQRDSVAYCEPSSWLISAGQSPGYLSMPGHRYYGPAAAHCQFSAASTRRCARQGRGPASAFWGDATTPTIPDGVVSCLSNVYNKDHALLFCEEVFFEDDLCDWHGVCGPGDGNLPGRYG